VDSVIFGAAAGAGVLAVSEQDVANTKRRHSETQQKILRIII
jgi:hypothetical protein